MMTRHKMRRLWLLLTGLTAAILTSCGELVDDTLDEEGNQVYSMSLDRHEVYFFVGDQCQLQTIFEPDNAKFKSVYWAPTDASILQVREYGLMQGLHPGSTWITAISVDARMKDSCLVNVMAPWELNYRQFQYEMAVFAHVTVDGNEADNLNHLFVAKVDDEVRSVGQVIKTSPELVKAGAPEQYVLFRIYSQVEAGETITFWAYDKNEYWLYPTQTSLTFDGRTYGTLSNLYPIVF